MVATDLKLQSLDNQRSFYASSNPTRRWLHQSRRAWVADAVRHSAAQLTAGRDLAIEIGPGAGLALPVLAGEFKEVVALDVNPAFLHAAREISLTHPNVRALSGDATQPVAGVDPADLVLCSEVLEHVPEPAPFIAGIYRLLAPGGVLVLTTPQRFSTVEVAARLLRNPGVIRLVRHVYGEAVVELGHISLRTAASVREMLLASGFEITGHSRLGCYLPVLAEAGGQRAQRWEARLQSRWQGSRMAGLLWTQCWIARRPA